MSVEKLVQKSKGICVQGKFDQKQEKPYSAVAAACQQICDHLAKFRTKDPASFHKVRTKLEDELGEELGDLATVVPNLDEIFSFNLECSEGDSSLAEAKNRLNFAFQRFVRVITSISSLVIILDDLQWADSASLDLVQDLVQVLMMDLSTDLPLLHIGIYRSNEVDDTHLLSRLIRDLMNQPSEDRVTITKIEVGNLKAPEVNRMIVDLLSEDAARTESLAEIVHRKTLGNAFFVIQFLISLQEQNLLEYNVGLTK